MRTLWILTEDLGRISAPGALGRIALSGRRNPAAAAARATRAATVHALRRPSSRAETARRSNLRVQARDPTLRPRLVRRTALINRLRASRDARVVRVAAPAGYGKTTLLAQWAARDPRPFAWVSLDQRDDDPVSFLTYIAAALDRIHPIDASVFRGAAAANDSMWATGLPRLGAALAAMPEPIVLVLDDIDRLEHRDCLDALDPLSKHLPEDSQLVLSGRAETSCPSRGSSRSTAVRGWASRVGPDRFEAKSLLAAAGVKVTDAEAKELNEHAEGWAAGLHLAALFLKESDDPEALGAFTGKDRFVADYLRAEHLSRMKPGDVGFLIRTAVLDRMNGALCDELLERTGSGKKLQSLEELNFFVVPLDHDREWYGTTTCSARCCEPSSSASSPTSCRSSIAARPRGASATGGRRGDRARCGRRRRRRRRPSRRDLRPSVLP